MSSIKTTKNHFRRFLEYIRGLDDEEKIPFTAIIDCMEFDEISSLYRNIASIYTDRLTGDDTLEDNSVLPLQSDYDYCMKYLFKKDSIKYYRARGIFACNVQCAGRVNEVSV